MTAPPFLIRAKNVVVANSGMLALPCGPFGLFASCEAVKCGLSAVIGRQMPVCPHAQDMHAHLLACTPPSERCSLPQENRVFVMTQYDVSCCCCCC